MTHNDLTRSEQKLIVFGTLTATMMQAVDTTIANIALPHMQGGLSASLEQVAWVLTSYIVATAIALMPTAYLANQFGVKRVFLISIACFTIASMLCGIATNITEMVIFRLLQGVFGAALVPLAQTTLLDSHAPEDQASAMSIWGIGTLVGPIIGPVLGGYLTEHYNWRWVFLINLPIGIASFLALSYAMKDSVARRVESLDILGFAFLSLAIGGLQLMLDRGQSKNWFDSTEILIEGGVAIVALYLFVVHTITAERPLISTGLFKDRNLLCGLIMIFVMGLVLYSTFAILPPFLQNLKGYPVISAGMVLAPRGLGTMITMRLAAIILRHFDPRPTIWLGMLLVALSLYWMSTFNLVTPPEDFIWSGFIQGMGLGFVFVPLATLTFTTLPPQYRNDGTALYSLLRNLGSSIGIALAFAFQDFGTKMAHSVLAENINPYNPAVIEYLNANTGLLGMGNLMQIDSEIQRQAGTIGMLGDFHYLYLGVFLVMPLLFLLKPSQGRQVEAADDPALQA